MFVLFSPWTALASVWTHSKESHSLGLRWWGWCALRSVVWPHLCMRLLCLAKALPSNHQSCSLDFVTVSKSGSYFLWLRGGVAKTEFLSKRTCLWGQRFMPSCRQRFLRAVTPTPSCRAASSIVEFTYKSERSCLDMPTWIMKRFPKSCRLTTHCNVSARYQPVQERNFRKIFATKIFRWSSSFESGDAS